jgi:hypothetical protein
MANYHPRLQGIVKKYFGMVGRVVLELKLHAQIS